MAKAIKYKKMKEIRFINIPENYKVDKIQNTDDMLVITFDEVKPTLPKTRGEFCNMSPIKRGKKEFYITDSSEIKETIHTKYIRFLEKDKNVLTDCATANAVLALCQLIQLRNCYNGDWIPDWEGPERKYIISFYQDGIWDEEVLSTPCILYFKSEELRDEFLCNFRPLIEKLKPLYGIKEGDGK